MLDRRTFLKSCVGFPAFALLSELGVASARTSGVSGRAWIDRQRALAHALRTGGLTQELWHEEVNALAGEVDLEALAAELRRARTRNAGPPFGHDPQKRFVTVLDETGNPVRLGYGLALFDFGPSSVITPHAHRHMASAHLVLEGRVRVRTFDRLRDEAGAIVIRPTGDVVADPGHSAAMTTPRDNIHWFTPQSARAMTLDVILDGLDPGADDYLIEPVDPLGGRVLADGSIVAPVLSFERSMQLYSVDR
jgi:hypothetical protein